MSGALMQLVAYGAQDIYLTGNPMITYFKTIYRRHTNFAMDTVQITFNDSPNFGKSVSALISRNGDLISDVLVSVTLPDLELSDNDATSMWVDHIGHFLFKKIEFMIGDQVIDRQYGDWLEIWSQLSLTEEKKQEYYEMIGHAPVDSLGRPTGLQKDVDDGIIDSRTIYIPMQFWFCRNVGLAIPLLALQYNEVKINIEFEVISNLVRNQGTEIRTRNLVDAKLWVEYVYLDTDERRRFANNIHEYLIEQIQYNGGQLIPNVSDSRNKPSSHYIDLDFNHPVKELLWVVQPTEYITDYDTQPANYTAVKAVGPANQTEVNYIDDLGAAGLGAINSTSKLRDLINQSCVNPNGARNPVVSARMIVNGRPRFSTRLGSYFNWLQPRDYHTSIPESKGINVYSFSLLPERHQPSGTLNFSKVDKSGLLLKLATFQDTTDQPEIEYPGLATQNPCRSSECNCRVYAVTYNVLRIMHGMGGLAYNN